MEPLSSSAARYEDVYGYDRVRMGAALPKEDWDVLPAPSPRRQEKQRQRSEIKTQVVEMLHPQSRAKRRKAVVNCLLLALSFIMLVGVVARYAVISETNLDNLEKQEHINTLEAQVEQLSMEIESLGDIQVVQQEAEKMGLGFAENTQVRYVTVPQPEEVLVEEQETPGFFESLWESIKGLF